jgi:DNA polymerase-3 subunit delta'
MALKDIFCQGGAVGLLQKAFAAGRVPHAYIFAGPEGVGKFKTAAEWAGLLLCRNPVVEKDRPQTRSGADWADSCGSCESCRALAANAHPDFNIVYKELIEFTEDGKGKKPPLDLPIDVIREFLIQKVSTRPTLSDRKVFIVSEAEKLNIQSQNCLLKVLEEPPKYCCIILLCTRMEQLLPTTKSRCQVVRFGPIDEEIILGKLKETGIGQDQCRYFARLAQGSLGLAHQWAALELAEASLYQTKKEMVASVVGLEFADIPEYAEKLQAKSKKLAAAWATIEPSTSRTDINRKAAKSLVGIVISVLYDAMKLSVTPSEPLINFDQKGLIESLAARLGPEPLAEKIADCYRMLRWIEAAVNERLIFEQLLFNLAGSDTMTV